MYIFMTIRHHRGIRDYAEKHSGLVKFSPLMTKSKTLSNSTIDICTSGENY